MRGFREALLMSMYLNRTICIPPFWKEKTEQGVKSLGDGLPGAARFDLEELGKIIKFCPTEMIKSHCGESFQSLMLGQNICSKYNQKRLDELHQRLSMKSVYTGDQCELTEGVKQFPPDFRGKMVKVPTEQKDVLEMFPDDSKCTLYLYPYINFVDSEKKLLVPFLTKGAPIQGKWLRDIVKHTPRPQYVHKIAEKFMSEKGLEKKNFVSIHWNFEKDYEDACKKKQGEVFCELANDSTAAYKALIKHIKLHNQKSKLKAIYFSASAGTLDAVLPELEPLWKEEFDGLIEILTRNDVKSYVQDNGCIGVPTDDSLETVEMEVCYRASAFLRAQYSIWSRTIDFERRSNRQRTLSDKLFTEVINLYK